MLFFWAKWEVLGNISTFCENGPLFMCKAKYDQLFLEYSRRKFKLKKFPSLGKNVHFRENYPLFMCKINYDRFFLVHVGRKLNLILQISRHKIPVNLELSLDAQITFKSSIVKPI